jgi:hypothetical protein
MAHADPRVHTEITEIGVRVFKDEIVLPKFFILARNRLRSGSPGMANRHTLALEETLLTGTCFCSQGVQVAKSV